MESNLVPKKDKRHCFDLMYHRLASVICVSCPFNMRYSSVLTVLRLAVPQLRSNGLQRVHTGYLQDADAR